MSDQLVADVEDDSDRITYRDAMYARVPGFQPLLLDLVVPRAPAPVAAVLYLHGGGFAAGTHKTTRDPLGRQVTKVLTARGIAVASVGYRLSAEARFPAPETVPELAARASPVTHVGVDQRPCCWCTEPQTTACRSARAKNSWPPTDAPTSRSR